MAHNRSIVGSIPTLPTKQIVALMWYNGLMRIKHDFPLVQNDHGPHCMCQASWPVSDEFRDRVDAIMLAGSMPIRTIFEMFQNEELNDAEFSYVAFACGYKYCMLIDNDPPSHGAIDGLPGQVIQSTFDDLLKSVMPMIESVAERVADGIVKKHIERMNTLGHGTSSTEVKP